MMMKDQDTVGKRRLLNSENPNSNDSNNNSDNDKAVTAHACFVAGTLVHTDKGLVPIQDIKVGDRVLSKAENGEGKAEYKPVLSTFKSADKQAVYKVAYFNETAEEQGENALHYLLCKANHPFWSAEQAYSDINANVTGKWQPAEDMNGTYLLSVRGDKVSIDDFACLPVRTLPNFPAGCAYTQQIFDRKMWQYDEEYQDVRFIQFGMNGYNYISYADGSSDGKECFKERWGRSLVDIITEINEYEPIIINANLYEKLNFRMLQDSTFGYHSTDSFLDFIQKEDVFVLEGAIEKNLNKIKKLGDSTGLKKKSIHLSMRRHNAKCPNPYEDYVYNIEVADHHTYFVGHDGIWVHNCDPCTLNAK